MNIDDSQFQYVTDADGHPTAIIVPIEVWNSLNGDRNDTVYLSSSPVMKERLLAAMKSKDSEAIELEELKRQLLG